MPGENGSALLHQMRISPRLYDIPVIMLTAVSGLREEQIANYHRAKDYIRKPLDETVLLFRVHQLLKAQQARKDLQQMDRRPQLQPQSSLAHAPIRLIQNARRCEVAYAGCHPSLSAPATARWLAATPRSNVGAKTVETVTWSTCAVCGVNVTKA